MNRNEEWNELIINLALNAVKDNKTEMEKDYKQQRQEHIDEIMGTNLTIDQRLMVEEILMEVWLIAEREVEVAYKQGLKDCSWMLKKLGVIA